MWEFALPGVQKFLRCTEPIRPLIVVINARSCGQTHTREHTHADRHISNSYSSGIYHNIFLQRLLLWSYYISVLVAVIPQCGRQAVRLH